MKYIFSFLFLCVNYTFAQTHFERVPPSPNAASLGKYGVAQVNLSNGSINPSIPLFELDEYGFPFLVSLNYSYAGCRPSDLPGVTGYGWNLAAGGVITRVVNSKKDDLMNGYYHRASILKTSIENYQATHVADSEILDIGMGIKDSEPDMFYFNFGSYSGSFFWGGDNQFHVTSQQKIHITAEYSPNPPARDVAVHNIFENFIGFTVTVEDGTQYRFYICEYSRATSDNTEESFHESGVNGKLISSWYLSEITGPAGQKITFDYSLAPVSANRVQFSYEENHLAFTSLHVNPLLFWYSEGYSSSADIIMNISHEVYLLAIKGNGWEIELNYEDFMGQTARRFRNYPKRLTNISLYNKLGSTPEYLKGYNLTYENYSDGYELKTLREVGQGMVELPPYTFSYYGVSHRPILTKGIDHFGFYNGKNTNISLMPALAGNRIPDLEYAKIGALYVMRYPTGGNTWYQYELNDYSYMGGELQTGTAFNDSLKTFQIIEGAFVTTPLIYINQETAIDVEIVVPPGSPSGCGSTYVINNYHLLPKPGNAPYTINDLLTTLNSQGYCFGTPETNTQWDQISLILHVTVHYPYLTNIFKGPGIRISAVYKTDQDGIYENSAISYEYKLENNTHSSGEIYGIPFYGLWAQAAETDAYFASSGSFHGMSHLPVNYRRVVEKVNGVKKSVYHYTSETDDGYNNTQGVPFNGYSIAEIGPFSDYSHMRGKLKREETLDSSVLLKTDETNYIGRNSYSQNFYSTPALYIKNYSYFDGSNVSLPINYLKFYKPVSFWIYPTSITQILYDENGANPVSSYTQFSYENHEHYQLTRRLHINSDGIIKEDFFKYPLDYKMISGKDPMIDSLINNHQVNTVIEHTVVSAGQVKDATVYTFAQHAGNSRKPRLFLPDKEYRFQAVGTFTPYSGQPSGINSASYYENTAFIAYDTLGQVLNIRDAAGVHTSFIRAYRARYPVGVIFNALKTEVDAALSLAGTSQNALGNETSSTVIGNVITALQGSMTASQVNGFLFRPFVGMQQRILPNAVRTDYEYDAFGRLSGTMDHNGHWTQLYEYQLKGETPDLYNQVISRRLRIPTTNKSEATDHMKATTRYEFFNTLGEPWQIMDWRQSPQSYNIVSESFMRDAVRRITRTYLPASNAISTPSPIINMSTATSNFYGEVGYTTIEYRGNSEVQMLTRGPGGVWAANNRNTTFSFGTAGSSIRKYSISSSNDITLSGTYPAYSITSSTVTDEQGNILTEYKDKSGLLVESQVQISSGQWAVTHFIYDGLGRLRAVIQPEGFVLNTSITSASAAFTNYVFCYEYDARGRMIRKHIPGAGWTETVYDKSGRPVMSQDAYQKTQNRWSFTQYDAFGREVVKGEMPQSTTRASAQALFDAHAIPYEGRSGATYNGASFPTSLQPALTEKQLLNYYDDYTFLESQFAFNGSGAFHSQRTNIKGLPAGAKKRNSRDNAKMYTDAFYYDDLNRMIQSQHTHQLSSNNTSNILVKNLEYNFAGEVTRKNSSFPFNTGTVTLKDKTDYDHAGRVTATALGINAEPSDIIHYNYDEIGRLKQKKYIGAGSSSSEPCDVLTDGLVMGTWTVTGHPLVARYFHNKWWLTQRIGSSPDQFIVRGSEMMSRPDVTLSNPNYSSLVNCFEWKYSDFEGIIPPATPSVFPVPAGYDFVNENGEEFFRAGSGVPCSTPATIVSSVPSPAVNQQLTLTTSCSTGTPLWSTSATTNSIAVTATVSAVTYSVTCQGVSCTTSSPVSITITGTSSGPCDVLTDGLVMGTWTVTGHSLVARYFHNKWWLVQRIGTSPDRFIVRGSEMISRPDVTLNNSGYSSLVSCFEWIYSDFEGIIPPPTPSVFPVPPGYSFVNENGEEFFQASSGVPCSTPTTIVSNVPSPTVNQQVTLSTSCSTGTPKWSTNATTNSITVTATVSAVTYSVTCQGSSCTTSPSVSITITGTPSGPCDVLTDGLVIGTWTVTGHPLVARYFHNKWWLIQRIGTSPEQFVVRASEMISRPDVTLNNSAYASLENCFEWQYSNYGGLEPPATPSVFAVPPNYSYLQDSYGEYYFQQNSGGRIAAVDFTGHTEPEDSQVKLFPNPAGDRFDVKIQAAHALKDVRLSVADMNGRVIYSATVDIRAGENTYPINSAGFSNGTYMVSLHKGLYRKSAKVVIMK